jgi:hypothetical protein
MRVEWQVRSAVMLLGAGLLSPAIAGAVDIEVSPLLGYRFGGQFHEETTDTDVDLKESSVTR